MGDNATVVSSQLRYHRGTELQFLIIILYRYYIPANPQQCLTRAKQQQPEKLLLLLVSKSLRTALCIGCNAISYCKKQARTHVRLPNNKVTALRHTAHNADKSQLCL